MIRKTTANLFRVLELNDPELSILIAGDERVAELNSQWRDESETTDVLSFPLHPPDADHTNVRMLGDIVINLEYAERLADSPKHAQRVADLLDVDLNALNWNLEREVRFLLIHGLLHLLGYDHATEAEQHDMKRQERRLWLETQD